MSAGPGILASVSQENVEIVRRALDAYTAGDIEGMSSFLDPDGELHSAIISGAEGKAYRGHAGIRSWVAETKASFEALSMELTEFRDLDDRVLAFGRVHAKGRESGVELDSPQAGSSPFATARSCGPRVTWIPGRPSRSQGWRSSAALVREIQSQPDDRQAGEEDRPAARARADYAGARP